MFSNLKRDFRRLMAILTPSQRRQLVVLIVIMFVAGVMEACSIMAVPAFLAAATSPESTSDFVTRLGPFFADLGLGSPRALFFSLGILLIVVILLSSGLNALATWAQFRFAWRVNHSVSNRLVRRYLTEPYSFFISRNSADLQNMVQSEVPQFVTHALMPLLLIVQRAVNGVFVLALVIMAAPVAALSSVVIFGLIYRFVYTRLRSTLSRLGEEQVKANERKFRALTEAFGAPKITKLQQAEDFFLHSFCAGSAVANRHQGTANVIASLPRYGLESVAFSAILVAILASTSEFGQFEAMVPLVGFFAIAAYRLLPAIQVVYASSARFRFGWPRLNMIYRELYPEMEAPSPEIRDNAGGAGAATPDARGCRPIVHLQGVSFRYDKSPTLNLLNVSLTIDENSTIGFCGPSGAGKTTLADIILGLLTPTEGRILVDGMTLSESVRADWQVQVGYVPQDIFLIDSSIAENIAFGRERDEIDLYKVQNAARLANIHDFIDSSLPSGYWTNVGERGVRLSGGQRQRIGIARALYSEPRLIVLDEATSNLDSETESGIMSAVQALAGQKTIIVVAHRIRTLKCCDTIYRLDKGRLVNVGSFDELFATA